MFTILVAILVVTILLIIINRDALVRMLGSGTSEVGKISRRTRQADPLALLNQAVEDGVTSIQNSKKGLENYRTLIASVQRQVESGEKEKARLEARIREAIESGDPSPAASEYAMMLADVEAHLETNREQLQKHKEICENFARQVELGQAKVNEARLKAARLGLELEQSKREKEMAKFASEIAFDHNQLESGFARAEELINQTIDANRAVGEVAADLAKPAFVLPVDEDIQRRAAAAKILDRFKKEPPATQSQ